MMTIPSIDMVVGSSLSAAENSVDAAPGAVVAPSVNTPMGMVRPQTEAPQDRLCETPEPFGLALLVQENAALGEALRAIVYDFDRPVAVPSAETALLQATGEHALPRSDVSDASPKVPVASSEVPVIVEEPIDAPMDKPIEVIAKPRVHDFASVSIDKPVERPVVTESDPVVAIDKPAAALPEAPVAMAKPLERPVVTESDPVVAIDKPVAALPEVPVVMAKPIERPMPIDKPIERPIVTELKTDVAVDKPEVAEPEAPVAVALEQPRIVRPRGVESVESDEVAAPVALDRAPVVEPIVAVPSPRVEADVAVASPETVERVVRVSELMGLAPAEPAAAVPSDQLVSAANEVASFILVTPSLMRGEAGEIRVQLRPDVLAGSEVVIAVDGRKMAVTFVPQTTAVADAVVTHTPQIVETLTARVEGFQFAVDVAQTVATNVAAAAHVAESSYRAPVRKSHERT